MTIIDTAYVDIKPRTSTFAKDTQTQVRQGMAGVPEEVGKQVKKSTDVTRKHVSKLTGDIKTLFKQTAAPIIGAASVFGAIGIAKGSIDSFKNLAIQVLGLQRVAGGTAEEMSRLRFAAEHSGVGAEALTGGLRLLGRNLQNSLASGKKTSAMVKTLGFDFRDAHGQVRPLNQILPQVADRFKTLPNGPEKTALAMKLFGRAGTALIPFLNKGSAGIAELSKKSDEFGTTLTGKNLAAFSRYRAQQREFNATILGLKLSLGGTLLVAITKVTTKVNEFIQQMRDGTGVGGVVADGLRTIGFAFQILIQHIKTTIALFTILVGVLKDVGKFVRDNATAFIVLGAAIALAFGPALVQIALFNVRMAFTVGRVALMAKVTKLWTAAQAALNFVMRANPLGLVITAIGALVAGVILAYRHSERFRTIVNAVGNALKTGFLAALNALEVAFHAVVGAFNVVIDFFKNNWKRLPLLLLGPVGIIIFVFKALPGRIQAAIGDAASWLVGKGKGFLLGFLNGAKAGLQAVVNWALRAPVVAVVAPFARTLLWLVTAGRGTLIGFLRGAAEIARTIGTFFYRNSIKPIFDLYRNTQGWLIKQGMALLRGFLNGVVAVLRVIGGTDAWIYRTVVKPLVTTFVHTSTLLLTAGKNLLLGFLRGVVAYLQTIGGIANWLWRNAVMPVLTLYGKAVTWLFNGGRSLIIGLLRGIVDAMRGVSGWLNKNVVQPIIKAVRDFFGIGSPSKEFQWIGSMMIAGLIRGIISGGAQKFILKHLGGMPKALAAMVGKGLIAINQLPKKALDALGSVAGFIAGGFSVNPGDVFTYMGKKIQGSTFAKLQKAQQLLGGTFQLLQGSFNTSVAASAGTHRGGGVIDVDKDDSSWIGAVAALRHVGFAAWHRDPSQGPWGHHIHAVEIGNPTLSPEAARQVVSYLQGGDGLAGYARGAWNILRAHLAMVHPGEMVAPAPVAQELRAFGSAPVGSSSVTQVTYIINAPHYVGDKTDLVKAIDELKRKGRI